MLKKVEKSIFLSKPIIGIVGRCEENYIKVNKTVVDAITKCGGIPFMILHNDTKDLDSILKICNGIVLPGGIDITATDKYICEYAKKYDIPILGICLGMQVMGCLKKDSLAKNMTPHQGVTHKIKTIKGTIISNIVGDSFVNSRHNEHITESGDYNVTSYSLDGYIESIEYPNSKFNVGVQWHPEDMPNDRLIKYFIDMCK